MRDRILEHAERLFRAYGYAKTTVADIAVACDMSPANVYRFFESKTGIHEALTEVILQRMETFAKHIVHERRPAAERLRKLVVECHQMTCEQYLQDSKVHEICAKAMAEQWSVIDAHCERMRAIFQSIVEDGVRSGEFAGSDIEDRARCVFNAVVPFCHPQIVAERFAEDHGRQAALMADFLVTALRTGK
ncbi:MAG: transcriptional regulator, TetR family [Nevskia sp.]|nr:transcriptional regulator, TetR family [Nevskia sp.]